MEKNIHRKIYRKKEKKKKTYIQRKKTFIKESSILINMNQSFTSQKVENK